MSGRRRTVRIDLPRVPRCRHGTAGRQICRHHERSDDQKLISGDAPPRSSASLCANFCTMLLSLIEVAEYDGYQLGGTLSTSHKPAVPLGHVPADQSEIDRQVGRQIGKWVEPSLSPIGQFVLEDWYHIDMKSLGQSYTAFPGRIWVFRADRRASCSPLSADSPTVAVSHHWRKHPLPYLQ